MVAMEVNEIYIFKPRTVRQLKINGKCVGNGPGPSSDRWPTICGDSKIDDAIKTIINNGAEFGFTESSQFGDTLLLSRLVYQSTRLS